MIKDLVKLANHLDAKGLMKEADLLDRLLFKMATEDSYLWSGGSEPVNDYGIELPKEVMDFLGEGYEGLVIADLRPDYVGFLSGKSWIRENNFYKVEDNLGMQENPGVSYHLYENEEGLRVAELNLRYSGDDQSDYFLVIPKIHVAPAPPEGFTRDEMVEELNFDSDMDAEYLGLKRGPTYDPIEEYQRMLNEQY